VHDTVCDGVDVGWCGGEVRDVLDLAGLVDE
jgi:hypothetical protein